jgi:hypothetical protein
MLAAASLVGAWLLARLDLGAATLGDGAPSGAGAFLGLLLILEALCILLAGLLLIVGWHRHDHTPSKVLFIFLFLPVTLLAAFSTVPPSRPSSPDPARGSPASPGASGSRTDGYIWALDANFLSEDECLGSSPEFVAGCKDGVARNRARLSK